MDLLNSVIRLCVFKGSPNLIAGHIEFVVVALPEIAGQGAERTLGGESERSSCSRHKERRWGNDS